MVSESALQVLSKGWYPIQSDPRVQTSSNSLRDPFPIPRGSPFGLRFPGEGRGVGKAPVVNCCFENFRDVVTRERLRLVRCFLYSDSSLLSGGPWLLLLDARIPRAWRSADFFAGVPPEVRALMDARVEREGG